MTSEKKNYTGALVALTSLFFMWGFITVMNDILIPFLRKMFALSRFESMMVQFAFFAAYFVGSVIYFVISARRGDPISKIGYKNGLILGLVISALASLLFYPAAQFQMFGLFLAALFILALKKENSLTRAMKAAFKGGADGIAFFNLKALNKHLLQQISEFQTSKEKQ